MDYPTKKDYTKIRPLIDWYIIAKYWIKKGSLMKKIFKLKELQINYFVFFVIVYLIATNTYFSYEQSLISGGADGLSYFEISKFAQNYRKYRYNQFMQKDFFHI